MLIHDVAGAAVAAAHASEVEAVRARAYAALDPRERARLASMADAPADLTLLGRHLVRVLATRALAGVSDAEVAGHAVVIAATCPTCGREHGRPTLPGLPYVVSIAHSRELVVAALAPTSLARAIGIDTEPATATATAHPPDGVPDLRTWVRSEAVAKAAGTGIVAEPDAALLARVRTYDVPTPRSITILAIDPA